MSPSNAHVVLEQPTPFLPAEYGPSNPVTAATFPCKKPAGTKLAINGSATEMAVGVEQKLSFFGQAVHGGGSCQISLTADIDDEFQPNPNSRFFVIHSIEGGCPARNQVGNLEGPNVDLYHFKIPEGVEPGNYVLSWSWVARIGGGPEFYQQCAPVVVTAAKPQEKRTPMTERRSTSLMKRVDFPDLFMANMAPLTGDCTHDEARNAQIAVAYPDPGQYVERPDPQEALFSQACNGNPRVKSGSGSISSTVSIVPTNPSSMVGTLSSSVTSTTNMQPSTITPSSSGEILSVVPITTSVSITPSPPANTPSSGAVCQEGHLLCVDGTHFSTCTGGRWTAPQPLAPGTRCTGADGIGLTIVNPM